MSPTWTPEQLASRQARREEPAIAAAIKAERDAFTDAASHLHITCLKLRHITSLLAPENNCTDTYTAVELLDAQLTRARGHVLAIRRAARHIEKRRDRENNGVFKP
jgi:hypothetical protein